MGRHQTNGDYAWNLELVHQSRKKLGKGLTINMCSCFDQNLVPSHLDIVLSS